MLSCSTSLRCVRRINVNFRGPGNPGNSNGDAVDVAPMVPAPEDEEAAEPAAAKTSPHGPVVQELDMIARQPNGSRSLLAGHIAKRTEIGNSSSWSIPPKMTFAISSENGNRCISEKKLPCTFWD